MREKKTEELFVKKAFYKRDKDGTPYTVLTVNSVETGKTFVIVCYLRKSRCLQKGMTILGEYETRVNSEKRTIRLNNFSVLKYLVEYDVSVCPEFEDSQETNPLSFFTNKKYFSIESAKSGFEKDILNLLRNNSAPFGQISVCATIEEINYSGESSYVDCDECYLVYKDNSLNIVDY